MSEKKLLEEGTIRRFMQLANIKPLNEANVQRDVAGRKEPNQMEEEKHAEKPGAKKMEEKKKAPAHKEKVEEKVEHMEEELEEALEEAYQEEAYIHEEVPGAKLEAEEPELDMGDMEGGDSELSGIEKLAQELISLLNSHLESSGSSKKIETEPGDEEEAPEAGEEEELQEARHCVCGNPAMPGKDYCRLCVDDAEAQDAKEEIDEEQLAEELTRRVAARLVAEMKAKKHGKKTMEEGTLNGGSYKVKGKSPNKVGGKGEKAASGHGATKHAKAPKGHGAGVKQGSPFNKGTKKK